MASKTVEQAAPRHERRKNPKGLYYEPAVKILDVPGVTKVEGTRNDFYSGTMDALVSARIATADMFPGQPGRPVSAVTYRPVGQDKSEESWIWVPGYLTIHRCPSGQFRAALTVSRELRAMRERAEEQRREARARESGIFLYMSPAIRRDFETHDEMALVLSLDRDGHLVPLELAEKVLEHVTRQLQRKHEMRRGLPRAYEVFQRQLRETIDREKERKSQELAQLRQQQRQRMNLLRALPATASDFRRQIANKFQVLIEQGLLPQMRAETGFRFTQDFVDDLVADMKASYFAILDADIEGLSPRTELARKDKSLQSFLAKCRDSATSGDAE